MAEHIKCVVVGDSQAGKSAATIAFTTDSAAPQSIPSNEESTLYTANLKIGGGDVVMDIVDSKGHEDYNQMRVVDYRDADVIIIMVDRSNPISLVNVEFGWAVRAPMGRAPGDDTSFIEQPQTIKAHFDDGELPPFFLFGNKSDLKDDPATLERLDSKGNNFISDAELAQMAKSIGAEGHFCGSATDPSSLDVFRAAAEAALAKSPARLKRLEALKSGQVRAELTSIKGCGLLSADSNGLSDPFLQLFTYDADGKYECHGKGKVVKKTLDPDWGGSKVTIVIPQKAVQNSVGFAVAAYDWNRIGSNDFLGEVRFPWSRLNTHGEAAEYELVERLGTEPVGAKGTITFTLYDYSQP